MTHRLAVASGIFPDLDRWREEFANRAELVEVDLSALGNAPRPYAGLVVMLERVDRATLASFPGLRVLGRAGIGLDNIDLVAAADHGVAVTHQPSYATAEVADHACAMVMAATRRLLPLDLAARSTWGGRAGLDAAPSMAEQTLGVLGLGRIGAAVATRMRPFFARVAGYDPAGVQVEGVDHMASIAEVLRASDVLTLHLPLTEQTRFLIDAEAVAVMPRGAVLVNVARGALLDESAVAAGLVRGHLAALCADVLCEEPPAPGNPLLEAPHVLLTPHVAWVSQTSNERLARWTLESVLDRLDGRDLRHGRIAFDPDHPPAQPTTRRRAP